MLVSGRVPVLTSLHRKPEWPFMASVNIRVIETLRPHDFEAPPVDIRNCICDDYVGNEWKMNGNDGKRYKIDQICTAIEMPSAGHS